MAVGSRARADETQVKPRSDAYVGLLGLSLLALTAAMLFAYLNWSLISEKPKPVQMAPAGGAQRMPAPPAGQNMPPPPGPPVVNPQAAPGQVPPGNQPPVPGNPPQPK
jgi:hypothetical protein